MKSVEAFKKSPYSCIKHNTYFEVYDRLFAQYRGKEITFVEVGIYNGGSLFMWREYFGPKARIIGVDLNPDAKRWEDHGFEIHIGSQTDKKFWDGFIEDVGPIDVFLDDGGHTFEQQIATTIFCLPAIKDGGLLVVEDTHTSYLKNFGGPSPISFVSFAKNIVDGVNHRFSALCEDNAVEKSVYSVRFYESIVAFEIDRKLAGLKSKGVSNGGETMGAKDFRHKDKFVISATQIAKAFRY